jgi:hypothetical protein
MTGVATATAARALSCLCLPGMPQEAATGITRVRTASNPRSIQAPCFEEGPLEAVA